MVKLEIEFEGLSAYPFGHVFPECSSLFMKIYADRACPNKETSSLRCALEGDSKRCKFIVRVGEPDPDVELYTKILELFKYHIKYHYCVEEAKLFVDDECVYTSDTGYMR